MSEEDHYSNLRWLKRIQEQSWEPEILISGIVLFALFQMPPVIRDFFDYLDNFSYSVFSTGSADETLSAILLAANYWLIAGFTAHLVLRSVWIAFVGLSYVYKKGVDTSRLNYRPIFKRILEKNTDYVKNILKLEKICSSVFAVSFLIFMSTIGAFIGLAAIVVILGLGFYISPDFVREYDYLVDPVLSVIVIVFLIDFIGLGLIKRIPLLSWIYYPFYRLISWLTLSPLYRNIYYGFISNHSKWKVGLAMATFILISFFMIKSIRFDENPFNTLGLKVKSEDSQLLFHGHYENLMGDEPSKRIHIPSDVVETNVLPVFVALNAGYQERFILNECQFDSLKAIKGINEDSLSLACLSSFYGLQIDGNVQEVGFLYHIHQKANQEGLITYLDISTLERGVHKLNLVYHFPDGDKVMAIVEFYKSAPQLAEIISDNELRQGQALLQQDSVAKPVPD
jgi:hypothetical protein